MKCLKFSLIFLLFVATHAEEIPSKDDLSLPKDQEDQEKPSDKRWIENNQSYQPQTIFSKEFPKRSLESEANNQESAKQERTFKEFAGYEAIQSLLLKALKPKPIVDTAEESEKLAPNEGSGVQVLGDLVVKGSEALSKVLNIVVDKPKNAITRLSKGATQALNQLGAYLIGL